MSDISDLLLVGIEVCVAFTGFAGIIATFQFKDERKIRRGDMVGLTMIVQISLMSALFCTLPLLLEAISFEDSRKWFVGSCLGALWMSSNMYIIDRNMRGAVKKMSYKLFFGFLQGVGAVLVVCLILNASNIVFHREPGPYLAALIFGVTLVGYMFGRLLLRPLWRALSAQEQMGRSVTASS